MPSDASATTGAEDFKPQRKLHPTSWLFVAAIYLKQFLVPLIVTLFVGANRDNGWWVPAIAVGPMIAAALWQQWVYRYGFSARGLVIHEGLFFRNVRTIEYGRIENVDTERGLLHRLFGVAAVRVETSTGGSAEAMIRVLDLTAVEEMRARIFSQRDHARAAVADLAAADFEAGEPADATNRPAAAAAAAAVGGGEGLGGAGGGAAAARAVRRERVVQPEEKLLQLSPGELVRFGLIDNRGMLIVAAVLGLLAQSGFFENMEERVQPLRGLLPWDEIFGLGLLLQVLLGITTAISLIVATRVLSIAFALVTLYDFRLTRQGGDLRSRYGLLTRISMTMRQRRIQAVHQTETLLHRLFKRVSLRVDLAGGSAAGGAQQQPGQNQWRELWLAPLCRPEEAGGLIEVALPRVQLDDLDWRGLAPRAHRRLFRLLTWWWLLLASVPAIWLTGWWAAIILPAALPLIWLRATLYVKYTGWALAEEFVVLKRGWLTRKLAVAPRNRIQSVHVRESPFDRRYRMAELHLDNAGASSISHRLSLAYMDCDDAQALAAALYQSRHHDGTRSDPPTPSPAPA